jgi:hypothetical protein
MEPVQESNWDMKPLVKDGEIIGITTWTNIYGRGFWNGSNVIHIDDGGPRSGLYYNSGVDIDKHWMGKEMDFHFWDFVETGVSPMGFRTLIRNIREATPLPKFREIR